MQAGAKLPQMKLACVSMASLVPWEAESSPASTGV